MKVLAIHNFHRKGSASGDDQVFKSETALLEEHGIEVIRYTAINDSFDRAGLWGKLTTALGMFWSVKHYRMVQKLIAETQPNIVHVHTFFPLLSPSVLYAAKHMKVPVVATLHDTRLVCPCATSLRGTQLCNLCSDGKYFRMCKYNCYKESRLQSFIVACIFKLHRLLGTFYTQIDKYICLNDNQIQLLTDAGLSSSKIVKKYNFVSEPKIVASSADGYDLPTRYVIFYGRIGEEKGIRLLMDIWENLSNIPLVVMGTGPLDNEFQAWAARHPHVYFLGYTQHEQCLNIVKNGEFVVFPSICYEGCSMAVIETESLGKALVTTDLGFMSEAIENNLNGYKIPLGNINEFVETINHLWNNLEISVKMGQNARKDYERKYTPEHCTRQLSDIYQSLSNVK